MAHPYFEKACGGRAMAAKRYAKGGMVKHDDAAEDRKMVRDAMKAHDEQQHEGKHTNLKIIDKD